MLKERAERIAMAKRALRHKLALTDLQRDVLHAYVACDGDAKKAGAMLGKSGTHVRRTIVRVRTIAALA